jgi:YD repeat-containing protein
MVRFHCLARRRSWLVLAALASSASAAAALPAFAANGSVVYTYDALGRISTASYDTGVCIAYTYDANGNRTSQKILVTSPTSTGVWGCFIWNNAKWGM